jgi:hypothetical protein
LSIYISSRSVFVSRYANAFAEYRFITVSPFTQEQVKRYLIAAGQPDARAEALLHLLSSSNNMLVIQIPRYLFLLGEFLTKDQSDLKSITRNQLFEYFIYSKLDLEAQRANSNKDAITKRLLEKLALTMEAYQTNSILKDEVMTFFDHVESDLKVIALAQIDLQEFFDKSLLKDNHDAVEFDNTEFQEYLAAKEITRFSDPRRAAFTFAVEHNINDLHPSWFNTLTFLVDMQPDLLEQLVEFSGMRGTKIVDEQFFNFLSRINPANVPPGVKSALFKDLVEYHQRHLQWIPPSLASFLPGLFDASQETFLKSQVATADTRTAEWPDRGFLYQVK